MHSVATLDDPVHKLAERACPGRSLRIEPLTAGLTNKNFTVFTTDGVYVLRIFAPRADLLLIDRTAEVMACKAAAAMGLAPEVVTSLPDEGILVTRYVDGRSISVQDMATPSMIARIGDALRRVHAGPALPSRLDPFHIAEQYHATAQARSAHDDEIWQWATPIAARIESAVDFRCTAPCHGDLLNANLIDAGTLQLLDWEYAGMSDPRGDLAEISAYHGFGAQQDRLLVEAYYRAFDENAFHAVRVLRFMTFLRAGLWAVLQQTISDLNVDFAGWAAGQFDDLRRWGSSAEFAEHLDYLERHPRR